MRKNRAKLVDRDAYYHCMSRVVNNQMLFEDSSTKQVLTQILKKVMRFSGVKIMNYAIMGNHYHLFIKVPSRPKKEISDDALFEKIKAFYGDKHSNTEEAFALLKIKDESEAFLIAKRKLRSDYWNRMYDLSECMKTFNHHAALWCMKHLEWEGTVWRDRFKSTLVQNNPYLKKLVSAYIDLNAVRANIVTDPKDYAYCGYTEALLENGEIRQSLQEIFGKESWEECQEEYRVFLAHRMKAKFKPNQTEKDREKLIKFANQVIEEHGELTIGDFLKMYSKHIANARVLGDKDFIEEVRRNGKGLMTSFRKKGQRMIAALMNLEENVLHADVFSQRETKVQRS